MNMKKNVITPGACLIWLIAAMVWWGLIAAAIYAAAHFVVKYW